MAEAFASADPYTAAAERPGNPTGAATAVIGRAAAFGVTAIDFGFFNRVVGLGVAEPAAEADVETASRFFLDLGREQSVIHVSPGARPPELEAWLGARGYVPGARWMKSWHDVESLTPPDPRFRIERIDAELAPVFQEVCYTAFGAPESLFDVAGATVGRAGWAHYLGFDGDTPVATGAMRLKTGVAWLGYGATLESHRGRGWHTEMLLRRLLDARAIGAWLAVTETGEETEAIPVNHSYRNMLRVGFRPAYARQNWVRLPRS
jgi:hypothetical protein